MAKLTRQQFINKIAPFAIVDMYDSDIPASLTIAQAILESADGNSSLSVQANNLFGIKGTGTAGSVAFPTTEYVNGVPKTVTAHFRKYNNWGESVLDHSQLFLNGVSWNRQLYHGVIGKDGITAAKEVAKAGYATDPNYSAKLIKLIQDYNLQQYDKKENVNTVNKDVDNLENKVAELEEIVKKIIVGLTQVADKLAETEPPEWFVEEFPDAIEMLNQKSGTNDFWRAFAITLRVLKQQTK